MSTNPLVSVIIPTYNYGHFITDAIDSVLSQTYQNFECIIVDDGSTDNTKKIVQSLLTKDSRIKYIYQSNQGLSAARNTGMRNANGDYLSLLDADDIWKYNKLENQLDIIENNKEVDLVFSNYEIFDKKGVIAESNLTKEHKINIFTLISPSVICPSSVLFSRNVYKIIGDFDVNLRSLEDLDYWFRIAINGFKFKLCEQKSVLLRNHNKSMAHNYLKMIYYHFIVLEKQIQLLKEYGKYQVNKEFVNSLLKRLLKIRYYAKQLKRKDLVLFIHLFGLNELKFKYFSKRYNFKLLFKDLFYKI